MRLQKALTLFVIIALSTSIMAAVTRDGDDKRPLEHEDYDRWNTIVGTNISGDGNWVMYTLRDGKEANVLRIRCTTSEKEYSIKGGTAARLTYDSQHVAYQIAPDKELIKKLKKEDIPEEELPQEKFQILNLESGSLFTMEDVQSFDMPAKNGDWIAILLKKTKEEKTVEEKTAESAESFEITPEGLKRSKSETMPEKGKESKSQQPTESKNIKSKPRHSESEEETNSKTGNKTKKSNDEEKKEKEAGTTLVLRNLKTSVEKRFPLVTEYRFDESGHSLAFATSRTDVPEQDGVHIIKLARGNSQQLISGLGNYKNLALNKDGTQLAFVTDRDDYQNKDSSWTLYHWKGSLSEAKKVGFQDVNGLPDDWWISSKSAPFFAEDNHYLYFFTAPKPEDINQEDDEDEDPIAKLDIWHWQDPLLQPQQLLQAEQERNRSYIASYNLRSRKIAQLATKQIPNVFVDAKRKSDLTIGVSDEKYKKTISWDMPGYRDVYLVNLKTGKSDLVLERARSQPNLSPNGKFVLWWDTESRNWFCLPTNSPESKKNISEQIKYPLFDELHDTPSDPSPYGIAGWTTNDKHVLVYDRFDIWQLDPKGESEPKCVTSGDGRLKKIRYRYRRLDPEARSIDPVQPMTLTAFDETDKDSGYFRLLLQSTDGKTMQGKRVENGAPPAMENRPQQLIMLPEQLSRLQKARQANKLIFTRGSFRRFPDIWLTTTAFEKIDRISKANPHQHEYQWGTVELTNWSATDGQKLEGLLFKPDDFAASKKYPLIVYFYERNSDGLHRHYAPAAGRSIINFTYYVSRGYVVFVPDIPYKTGEPGPSAANSVLPGVKNVVSQGYIDKKRIGMQGHSWGGYQTAYLVTQTGMFACAESGAPVSNMTSAYGGIRWASGLSRMFQYERSQSRIGDTLWNARDKYIANSPLFFVDKINTPLLILHNDNDGAVPWYQGIELFVAMRRLEKPAWLLNYNDNPHWVMGRENRLDFARRMQQFFDHYLKDDPMPQWMADGIPAVDKGKKFGFEPAGKQETEQAGEEIAAEESD